MRIDKTTRDGTVRYTLTNSTPPPGCVEGATLELEIHDNGHADLDLDGYTMRISPDTMPLLKQAIQFIEGEQHKAGGNRGACPSDRAGTL